MKYIKKNAEPQSFTQWKGLNIPLGMGYGELHSNVKQGLHTALVGEQASLCCYCERSINRENSHIEHFCPQNGENACPEMGLEYENLHASCQRDLQP